MSQNVAWYSLKVKALMLSQNLAFQAEIQQCALQSAQHEPGTWHVYCVIRNSFHFRFVYCEVLQFNISITSMQLLNGVSLQPTVPSN